ncbi:MAG: PLDc_N domain-containing protein [Dehalococcoidia bacterium]|nr:PLDc_N domain-containing protein [Dehalococcoidia bacterium]
MNELEFGQVLLLVIPLALVQIGLLVFALYDLIKRERVRGGNKLLWGLIIVLLGFLGPILYFMLGRED